MRKTNIWFLNLLFFTGIGLGSCNQADKDSKYYYFWNNLIIR